MNISGGAINQFDADVTINNTFTLSSSIFGNGLITISSGGSLICSISNSQTISNSILTTGSGNLFV
jgi:hypothetical protein